MEPEVPHIASQVNECLAEAVTAHPWLVTATDGLSIDPTGLDPTEIFEGLVSLIGALTDSVNLLATAIDRQNELLSGD